MRSTQWFKLSGTCGSRRSLGARSSTRAQRLTYYGDKNSLQIVFQLDHQDLTKRLDELGLLPASG
jgi:hypothetical protein